MNYNTRAEEYWQGFISVSPPENPPSKTSYQAWSFGDTPKMADELSGLVLQGRKTATASLEWVYTKYKEILPQAGEYNIILDGQELPVCITRTTEVSIIPFLQVSAQFAFDEGEGDQSLDYWRKVHWEFFSRECQQIKIEPSEEMPIVCERFEVVYP